MIRSLITLVLVFIVGWLVYTQVLGLGTQEEQEQGAELVQLSKKTFSKVFNILKSEGQKIKDGTYDDAINQLGSLLDKLRAKNTDSGLTNQLDELKKEEERIKEEIAESKSNTDENMTEEDSIKEEKTKKDLKKLAEDIEKVVSLMDKKNK